uniref:Glycosyltransferase n=1 Tax=Oryza barthii TaxID=65489 RepID=A0A0D3G9G1_9ORYZ
MASTDRSKKLRVLLIPFFATSHIGPFTDLAVRLVTARPDAVEPTIAVTPANVSVVRSALERHGSAATSVVSIATYPFPEVAGLPRGVENLSTAGADGWRIDVAATNEALTRPAQEALISGQSPDALITDAHFFWNAGLAEELGVPCVSFSVIGLFSGLAMRFVTAAAANDDSDSAELTLAGFPGAELRFPKSELPDFLIRQGNLDGIDPNKIPQGQRMCHGLAVNAFLGMEQPYRERFLRDGLAKRVYLVGPLSLPQPPAEANAGEASCIGWLDSKPSWSVLYVCFGTFAPVSEEQLDELALGLEASGEPFLWAVRADGWSPPAGWEERVGERGVLVRGWVPQTAILSHPATAAFLTHCGSSSLLEAVAAGVPLLTWPLVFDQFIEERLVTDVLRIGERVWDGPRSVRHEEAMVVPAAAVARALARFLEPGGAGDAARLRAQELAAEAHAAVAEGGSSYRDLRRLVDDMVEARAAGGEAAAAPQPQ